MNIFSKKWNTTGLRYAFTLCIVVGLVIFGSWLFNSKDPTWTLISAIVCTELSVEQVHSTVFRRILATLVGATIAYLILVSIGPGYISLIMGVVLTTLLCHYAIPLENNWKLATATGVLILVAGLQQHSVVFAEEIAFHRAIEVIAGSLTAGIISYLLSKLLSGIDLT